METDDSWLYFKLGLYHLVRKKVSPFMAGRKNNNFEHAPKY